MTEAAISDHGLIGDLQTAALIGRTGSVNWFCCPRFDKPGAGVGGRRAAAGDSKAQVINAVTEPIQTSPAAESCSPDDIGWPCTAGAVPVIVMVRRVPVMC